MQSRPRCVVWITFAAVAAGFAGSSSRCLAGDGADVVDALEDKALRAEAQAKFGDALSGFREAFDACAKRAQGGGAAREVELARAEVILEKIDSLAERLTRQRECEQFLARYDAKALGPVLEARARFDRAQYLLAGGDLAGAAKVAESLGLVRHYWVIGPFDNERGRGFKTDFGPEKKLDLDTGYTGKERGVAWRELPVTEPLGYLDLDAVLRPHDQCAAYAVAFVRSAEAGAAAVRLGSDEAVRVWWNGKEVLTRDVRRRMQFDQDVVGVTLNAGWNVLLIKVHDQTGEWGLRARLTAADGSPLAGVAFATTRDQADEASKAAGPAVDFRGRVSGGAKQRYDSLDDAGDPSARDLFHLGYLHYRREFDSHADRRAENLLRKASEAEPKNAIYRFHYAEAAAPPAEMTVEKEENRQRAGREKAIELDPTYAVAYRALASYYTHSLENLDRAERLLRKALAVNPDYWQARLDLSAVLERRGLGSEGDLEREKALAAEGSVGVEEAARVAAQQAEHKAMGPDAAAAWRLVVKLDGRSNDARRKAAELAARALDWKGAISLLDEMTAWNPYDTSSRARKAELLEGAEDFAGAAAALSDALRVAPEDDGLLLALGRVEAKAGRDKESLATLREALRINPKLTSIERYVEFLDPEVAPYEDDYHVDIAALIGKAKDYQNPENDGWITLLDQTVTKVNRDATSSNYTHMAAKILTEAGKKQFDRYYAGGWGASFKWKVARVVKPDGRVIEAKTSSYMADFPPLEIGDVIDVEFRRDDRVQSVFGDYYGDDLFFADQVPALRIERTLLTPAERTFYFNQKNFDVKPVVTLKDDGRTRVYGWTSEDVAKVRQEPEMPDMREIGPQVQVSTYQDWSEFARWWSALIKDQHQPTDEIKAKVAELVAGKETRIDKLRAIYEFVTGKITYQAWAFGPHGYKPYTAAAIFEKKEGDCKDKAILFNTMIKEIGVEGYPVLIYAAEARGKEDLSLPMVGHFNHCIAYVPDADGKGTPMFFDGTAEYASAFLPPVMDQGARVLVVKPDGAELMTVPKGAPESMGMAQKWHVVVRDDGSATATCEMTWRGDYSVSMRQMFSVEGQRPLVLQRVFRSFGKLSITDSKFDDLKDLSKPEASFRVTLEIAKFVQGSGDALTLPTAFIDASGGLKRLVARPTREHDLVMSTAMSYLTEAEYELPPGWTVTAPPEDAKFELPSASFVSTASSDGSKLRLRRDLRMLGERVTVSDYAAFREAVTRAGALTQQQWKVKKGESPPPSVPSTPPAPADKPRDGK